MLDCVIGNSILLHGECLKIMSQLDPGSVDAVITDPPYGTTACKWDSVIPFEPMWEQLNRVIKPTGAVVLFGSEPFSSKLRLSNLYSFKYDWIYTKSHTQNFLNAKKQPLRNHEMVSVFYAAQCTYNPQKTKGPPYTCKRGVSSKSVSDDENITNGGHVTVNTGERYPLSILNKIAAETGLRPTQKPVPLMEYLVKTYTNEGETVLDFTMGSGTTGVACRDTNRKFIGIEKDEQYFKIARQRISDLT